MAGAGLDQAADLLRRHARGELSAAMALHHLLLAHRDAAAVRAAIEAAARDAAEDDPRHGAAARLLGLLDAHQAGIGHALAILAQAEGEPAAGSPEERPEEGIERWRRLFDWAVGVSPAASVALYSLGDPKLLDEAAAEVVGLMGRLGILAPECFVLDVGCGVGRFEQALAPHVAAIVGIDVSAAMLQAAAARCAGLANVGFALTSGRDLAAFADGSFDVAIAVDSLPYLYAAGGPAFVARFMREVARVLRPGGDALAWNLSYRGDPALDRADALAFARGSGLALLRNGGADLRLWDGLTFHWRKEAAPAGPPGGNGRRECPKDRKARA